MEPINELLGVIVGYVWDLPMVILLVGSGLLFSVVLGGIQFKGFKHALDVIRGKYTDPSDPGEISHFQALCTALSATVGLGNIAGVAVAIQLGGPGAVFWMVLTGMVGMATKYSEVTISLMYRHVTDKGVVHGGAMHYIERGLGPKFKPMALFFAFACMCASFGAANMFQTNQVASILDSAFGVPRLASGIILAILTAVVIIGGIKRIGKVTSILVPLMGGIYVAGALIVIGMNFGKIPSMFMAILHDAFTGTAAFGGVAGIAIKEVLVQGVRRACFSNEAGLGSSPIAHSAATTKEPVREGVVALLEPFVDTVVICTMTALVILLSGAWGEQLNGVDLTAKAFDSAIPGFGAFFVPVAVFLFAYSTLLSWSYYGEQAVSYLFGDRGIFPYKIVFCIVAALGSVWSLDAILSFSDIMLGLMVVPNMIAVLLMLPRLKKESDVYFQKLKRGEFKVHK
ncbi:MAG: sodium:alanine symporter family protein [Bdellovibrionales bacterium]|nr:sodium:alanine symporter family protein [Bdellovibrionales bacterium]